MSTVAPEPDERSQVARFLWDDSAVYARRREKLDHARTALRLACERRARPSSAIVELASFLAAVEADDATPVGAGADLWLEPAAYHWTRTLYDLTAVVFGGADASPSVAAHLSELGIPEPARALDRLADDHKLFATSGALLGGTSVQFARPWSVRAPLAFPGTPLVLEGAGEVRILGVRAGRIEVESESGVRLQPLRRRPAVRCGGREIPVVAEAFGRPGIGLGIGDVLREISPGFQEAHLAWLQNALDRVVRHHPRSARHIEAILRVVALKPTIEDVARNVSHSDFPGATVLGAIENPYWLADSIIHEVHHSRLFQLEEHGRFFENAGDNLMRDASYYSPWREDPRPLHGIFHAVYVNLPVWHFWAGVRESAPDDVDDGLAESQMIYVALLLAIGIRQLERYAAFSAFGRALFDEMAREAAELLERTHAFGIRGDTPAWYCAPSGAVGPYARPDGRVATTREVLLEHLDTYDVQGQCADLRAIVEAA